MSNKDKVNELDTLILRTLRLGMEIKRSQQHKERMLITKDTERVCLERGGVPIHQFGGLWVEDVILRCDFPVVVQGASK